MGKQYTLGCISLYDGASAATHISASSISIDANTQVSGNDSGSFYEEFQSVVGFDPTVSVTSKCVKELLSWIGLAGQCVGPAFDVTRFDAITRQIADCQNALSGTPHIRDRFDDGLLTLGSLGADRSGDAALSVMFDAITDGTNAPITRTDGVALPSPVIAQRYALGLPAFGGVTFPDTENWSLDFGVSKTEKSPSLGSIWTDSIGVLTVRPTLTIRNRDISKLTQALLAAASDSASHADTKLQLIARENAGSYQDFGDSVHIGITIAGLLTPQNILNAASNQRATNELRISASYDGTNAPILFDLSSTYDTSPP